MLRKSISKMKGFILMKMMKKLMWFSIMIIKLLGIKLTWKKREKRLKNEKLLKIKIRQPCLKMAKIKLKWRKLLKKYKPNRQKKLFSIKLRRRLRPKILRRYNSNQNKWMYLDKILNTNKQRSKQKSLNKNK